MSSSRNPPARNDRSENDADRYPPRRNDRRERDYRRDEDRRPPNRQRDDDRRMRDMRDRERDRKPRGEERGNYSRDGAPSRHDSDRDRRRDREASSRRSASPPSRASRPRASRSRSPSGSEAEKEKDKAKPNFGASGLLAAATKSIQHADGTSTVLKYHEPPEARKPPLGWRLYVFKGSEQIDLLHIHRQSAYLIGRDRLVADIPVEHPSCSKQHAVIQYRQVVEKNEYGESKQAIKPFIIDLESTNGTFVGDSQIPTSRYYELRPGDVIKFGESAREYVLLHDDAT